VAAQLFQHVFDPLAILAGIFTQRTIGLQCAWDNRSWPVLVHSAIAASCQQFRARVPSRVPISPAVIGQQPGYELLNTAIR